MKPSDEEMEAVLAYSLSKVDEFIENGYEGEPLLSENGVVTFERRKPGTDHQSE